MTAVVARPSRGWRERGRRLVCLGLGSSVVASFAATLPVHGQTVPGGVVVSTSATSLSITPTLGLSLAGVESTALPGSTVHYRATVTNTGAVMELKGTVSVQNASSGTDTVSSWSDDFVYQLQGDESLPGEANDHLPGSANWIPLAGAAATAAGYVPAQQAPMSTGMTIAFTPVAASGVTYPSGGDKVLGTSIGATDTATWQYDATMPLTPSQVRLVTDATQIDSAGDTAHLEVSPQATASSTTTAMADVTERIFGEQPDGGVDATLDGSTPELENSATDTDDGTPQSGRLSNVVVKVTSPSGSLITLPGVTLDPGISQDVVAAYTVPVPAPKGANETDTAYMSRLGALDRAQLSATATASGSSVPGAVSAPSPASTSITEQVPLVSVAKSGPVSADASTTASYPITVSNAGHADALGVHVSDVLPSGGTPTIGSYPTTVPAGQLITATAQYAIPSSQASGSLTDIAGVTWSDGNSNSYGPLSSTYATSVVALFDGATVTLSPAGVGPLLPGMSASIKATVRTHSGVPLANTAVVVNVAGPNATSGTVTTDSTGSATFSYTGSNTGTDQAQATVTSPPYTLQSNTVPVGWVIPVQPIATTTVTGQFFSELSTVQSFVARPGDTPVFGQSFPDLLFNPPSGTVPGDHSGLSPQSRPFTDELTTVAGLYTGTLVAQGNGAQAGVGNLSSFDAAFTASFMTSQAEDVTFKVITAQGFNLGLGGGAWRVSGPLAAVPPGNSAFQSLPVVASTSSVAQTATTYLVTVHFPAAGIYPYELDYFTCCSGDMTMTMQVASYTSTPTPLSVYVGYADDLRAAGASVFPYPWQGAPNVTYTGACCDNGAVRIDNNTTAPITVGDVSVDIGAGNHVDLGTNLTVPARSILIATANDTSDYAGCGPNNGVIPKVYVTTGGSTQTYNDTQQVLNTQGFDMACVGNESHPWVNVSGTPSTLNLPIPPAASLSLTPTTVAGDTTGQQQNLAVAVMDSTGSPVSGQQVTLQVVGANAQQLNGTTDSGGNLTLSYVGRNAGTDTVQAIAFVTGMRALSNSVSVPWALAPVPGGGPGQPAPSITAPSPADGTVVTQPMPIHATFTPPAGQTITSWSVTYQALDPEPPVTLASGTGTPPDPLAVFDPTVLANDTYAVDISATASGGATQTVTTTLAVSGNLKLGRFTRTYQDLSVPVNGFQMDVRRSYDSYDKRSGDFGAGWHVSVSNFRTSSNRELGAGGWSEYPTRCIIGLCWWSLKTSTPHYVTVTFPDLHQEVFDFTPSGGAALFYWEGNAAFTARAGTGTTSTLQVAGDTSINYGFDGNIYDGDFNLYSPTRFQLTTRDGRVLILDTALGLISETDRSGNSLSVDSGGVHASNGQSITFTRDAQNRITAITDPSGTHLGYTYTTAGDLGTYTDGAGQTFTYSYSGNHDLTDVTGPTQALPLEQEQYDSSGRLVAVTDANGNTTSVSSDVGAMTQTFTDPLGRKTTVLTFDALGDVVRKDVAADGHTTTDTYTYDGAGHMLTHTDPLGHTTTATYDSAGDVTSLALPSGRTTTAEYGSFGNVTKVTDGAGDVTTYAYDTSVNLTSTTDANGHSTTYTYDGAGHVLTQTDAAGDVTTFTYDASGRVASVKDPRGNTTTYGYDGDGRLLSMTDPYGKVTGYTYDGDGDLLSTTDPLNHATAYAYDGLDRLHTTTDPAGKVTTYGYDGAGHLASVVDSLQHETDYTYDLDSQLHTVSDPAGGLTAYAYDGRGRVVSITDPIGRVTGYGYDDAGRQTSMTAPNSGVTTSTYDADGLRLSSTDPLLRTTTYTYDGAGRLHTVTDPRNHTTTYTVDGLGHVTATTDAAGGVLHDGYDTAGRLTSVTDQLNHTWTYALDGNGNITGITDPLPHTTNYGYDNDNRLTSITNPLGKTTSVGYDVAGHMTSVALPSGVTTSAAYDPRGLLTSLTDQLGHSVAYGYDAAGRLTGATDPDNHTTTYGYDAAGRWTTTGDALGGTATTVYDLAGQARSVTDPSGRVTSLGYDALGNLSSQQMPWGAGSTFSYDAAGQLTGSVDARNVAVSYAHDASGDLTGVTPPDPSQAISASYDALDRVSGFSDPTGTTSFGYDAASNVTSVTSPQGTAGYAYDAAGRRTGMTLPGNHTVSYGYDAANRLTSVADWLGNSFGYTYNVDDLPTGITRPNGVSTTYGYDGADRLTSVNHDTSSGAVAHYAYTLDNAGNPTAMTTAGGTESYTLDALNRVTGVSYANGDTASYTYDAAGNRLSATVNGSTTAYHYNSGGQLTSVGSTPYTYDAAGNLTSNGTTSYTYDWAGRLSSATAGGQTTSFTYAGDGLRTGSTTGSQTSSYLYDRLAANPTLLSDGSQTYVRGSVPMEQVSSSGATADPLSDGLDSVRTLTNPSTGAVTGATSYGIFGDVRSHTGASSALGFDGEQQDASGLVYLRARYLDPGTGRFLTADNILPNGPGTQGFNLYGYAGQSPLSYADPSGHLMLEDALLDISIDISEVGMRFMSWALANSLRGCLVGALAGLAADAGTQVAASGSYSPNAGSALSGLAGCLTFGAAAAARPELPVEPEPSDAQVFADQNGVGRGPYADRSVPATSTGRATPEQQSELNDIFGESGCHTCGTKNPGTVSGNAVGDHQPPTALTPAGEDQSLYPQCLPCSNKQGGTISGIVRRSQ